ncbi:hypothetical protein H2203_002646 [Taxawa tesnikishii (nom. ined.)]|nr:hypothetical protein H2203_002646 [Dothideales sp. JES 119]
MSAIDFQVITLVFPDPTLYPGAQGNFQRVNSSVSFSEFISGTIRTLSTNTATQGVDVSGLLYTPDLAADDPCVNASAPYVPANVTRQSDLPDTDYDLIAIAPWRPIGPYPRLSLFLPNQGSSLPPTANDAVWSLGDGGQWKSENRFPVYAVPTNEATLLMYQSSLYSGNMTDVPYGHALTETYDSRDYVRLFMNIDTGAGGPNLPSLWVFLLIILAILLAIVGITSLSMHLVQRRRREHLRRRVANGEVDLEALGIKRLTVPQELLDKMPQYAYGSAIAKSEASQLEQPTCPICIDDFVDDTVLPVSLVQKSVLPKGYCPANVTNAMVRRERMVRRLRPRSHAEASSPSSLPRSDGTAFLSRVWSFVRVRDRNEPSRASQAGSADVEMQTTSQPTMSVSDTPPPAEGHGRREWARRRAVAMLGPHRAPAEEEEQRRPRWRKWVGGVFPGLA